MAKHRERRTAVRLPLAASGRLPATRDLRVRHLYYRRSLKHATAYSMITSVALCTATSLLALVLSWLGVFAPETGELTEFVVGVSGVDFAWSWWYLAYVIPGIFLVNLLVFWSLTVINVFLFNLATDLTGGIVLRLEALSEVD